MNIQVIMITGDNERTAKAIAAQVGIDHARAEVLPEGKAEEVRKLQAGGKTVAMVGDGLTTHLRWRRQISECDRDGNRRRDGSGGHHLDARGSLEYPECHLSEPEDDEQY